VSETDRVLAAQRGDERAWEALIEIYQQPVFRLAYLLLGSADEAEDIAQETFIHAFHAIASFDVTRPLRPWLLRITTNLASNRRRSLGRYLAALRRAASFAPTPAAEIRERSAEQWEAETLWRAVQRLSRPDQEVIYLRYFLDLSEAETAAALQIAAGTVKSRLSRALVRLRSVVDREYPALREGRLP
jgi:RNA polymerase sigma-70 factor, ECF subfamily